MKPRDAAILSFKFQFAVITAVLGLVLVPLTSGANSDLSRDVSSDYATENYQRSLLGTEKAAKRSDCTTPSPGNHYVCIGTTWTYFDTVLSSGGILPLSSGDQSMTGGLYMAEGTNITLSSLSTRLLVDDCANLAATVAVTLSLSDAEAVRKATHKSGGATYLLIESSCAETSGMKVALVSTPRECYQYSARLKTAPTTAGRFGTFLQYSVRSTRCHYWWITLLCIVFITPAVLLLMLGAKLLFCAKPKSTRRRVSVAAD